MADVSRRLTVALAGNGGADTGAMVVQTQIWADLTLVRWRCKPREAAMADSSYSGERRWWRADETQAR